MTDIFAGARRGRGSSKGTGLGSSLIILLISGNFAGAAIIPLFAMAAA